MSLDEIMELPVAQIVQEKSHSVSLGAQCARPRRLGGNAALGIHLQTNIIWYKTRKDGGPDGRGVGFYFRNVTEMILFGTRGKNNRTLRPGRTQTNIIATRKREHSRKPEEQYDIIERCSPGPYLEMFARHERNGWHQWGNEAPDARPLLRLLKRDG